MSPEASVVGGGPAGLLAATELASRGYDTIVLEENRKIGEPNHCAGLISVEGFNRLGIKASPIFHQNTIYGGRIYSPDGEFIEIRDSRPRAYVVDRISFDQYLSSKAIMEGVSVHTCARVEAIQGNKLRVNNEIVESKLIVNAEGAGGRLMKRSGYNYYSPELITGFNVELNGVNVKEDLVEIWFGENLARDFFAWVIPLNESRVRVGLGTSSCDGIKKLSKFISKRFGAKDLSTLRTGQICIGGPVSQTVYDNILLVGDVAGQVKATTGGGIVIGGLCAQLAGVASAKYLEKGVPLLRYEKEWRKKYGFELKAMRALRKVVNDLNDTRFNRIFNSFKREGLENYLQHLLETGDIDMQSNVIRMALLNPKVISVLLRGMGRLAMSEMLTLFDKDNFG